MAKVKDLVVVVGEYQTQQGETKKQYRNVGSLMEGNDGGQYIILERTFNFAGLPNPDNRSNCIVSMFEPKPHGQQQAPSHAGKPAQSVGTPIDPEVNIPF